MTDLGGIFLDVFARLNMPSVSKTLSTAQREFREGGEKAGKAFSEGGVSGLRIMQDEFRELARASDMAFGQMQRGLAQLQVDEARINDLRARGFKRSSDEMIAAEGNLQKTIARTNALIGESRSRAFAQRDSAADLAAAGGLYRDDRGRRDDNRGRREPQVVPTGGFGRAGNAIGVGALVGTLFGGFDAIKQSAELQDNLNRLVTVTKELPQNLKMIQDSILRIATKTGYNPEELSKVALQAEKRGYKGGDLSRILDVTAQLSRQESIPLDEALQGIAITAQNYPQTRGREADLASKLNAAVGISGTSMQGFVGALPNVEQRAAAAGISQEQVWGVLAQLTRSGLSADRASQNEDSLIRALSRPNKPAQDMLNTLFSQSGAKNAQGKPMTSADISTNLRDLQITGAVNAIMNQAVLPNLTKDQKILLPTLFKNTQAEENIKSETDELQSDAARRYAQNPEFMGGMVSGFKVRSTAKGGVGAQLLAEGASPEDIDKLSQMASQYQTLKGFAPQLKNRDSDVQSITGILSRVFGTVEASRAAMVIGAGDNPQQAQADTARAVSDIGAAHADANGNVEGFGQSMNTTLGQTKRAKAAWHDVAITLGDQLNPAAQMFMRTLADMGEYLSQHKVLLDSIAGVLGTIGGIWAGGKLLSMGKSLLEPTVNLAKLAGGKIAGLPGNLNTITNPYPGGGDLGAGVTAGAKEGAPLLTEGVTLGAKEGAPLLSGGVAAGAKEAAPALTEGVEAGGKGAGAAISEDMIAAGRTAGGEVAGEMGAAGAAAGGKMAGVLGPAIAAAMMAGPAGDALWKNFNEHPNSGDAQTGPGQRFEINPKLLKDLGLPPGLKPPGQARGGIIGYAGGTGSAGEGIMDGWSPGTDDHWATVNGKPVMLSGGEGILVPEAARALGSHGVDAINRYYRDGKGKDPFGAADKGTGFGEWSNPLYTGMTFASSFAEGVAKYSPWGRPFARGLSGAKDMLKNYMGSPEGALKDSRDDQRSMRDPIEADIEQMLASGATPEEVLQQLGAVKGKRGGYHIPGVGYLSGKEKESLGLPNTGSNRENVDKVFSVFSKYFPQSEWPAFYNLEMHEAGFKPNAQNPNSTAYGIGQFLDQTWGSYGSSSKTSDITTQADSMMKYIKGRYGSPSAAWNQYYDHPNGEGSYSRGGVVGFSGGGIIGFDGGGVTDQPNPPMPSSGQGAIGGLSKIMLGAAPAGTNAPAPQTGIFPGYTGLNKSMSGGAPPQGGPSAATDNLNPQQGIKDVTASASGPGAAPSAQSGPDDLKYAGGAGPFGALDHPAPNAEDRTQTENPSRQYGMNNTSQGFGISGGLIGLAEQLPFIAAGAAGGMGGPAGGAGAAAASAVAQIGMQLANRAIGYGGQLVGIGLEGLKQTFSTNDSPLADPSNSLGGKIISGIAGAHAASSIPNYAGKSIGQIQPQQKDSLDPGAQNNKSVPNVNIGNIHNYSGDGAAVQRGINAGFSAVTGGMNIQASPGN